MKKIRALVLFSGGLDSILAAKVLRNQGVKITAISFKSYFFDGKIAQKAAKRFKIPLKVIALSKEHLNLVKNPKHGYGKSMNPCIDCHILMLRKAKEIMTKGKVSFGKLRTTKFHFVATGEVLGERPMSQNRKALEIIEKESGLQGYLLRPLSAKLLKPTVPEKMDWVSRKKLLNISGRSRKRQIALAKKWKFREYPTPAGGCLLTDMEFGKRLKELFKIHPGCDGSDVELLKLGRHFIFGKAKVIVGRNQEENKEIKKFVRKKDILIEMKNYPGPSTLIRTYDRGKISPRVIQKAKSLTQDYSTKARDKKDVRFTPHQLLR